MNKEVEQFEMPTGETVSVSDPRMSSEIRNRINADMSQSVHTSDYVNRFEYLDADKWQNWHSSVDSRYVHSYIDPVNNHMHIQMSIRTTQTTANDMRLCDFPALVPFIKASGSGNVYYPYACTVITGSGSSAKHALRDIYIGNDNGVNYLFIAYPQDYEGTPARYLVFSLDLAYKSISSTQWAGSAIPAKAAQLYQMRQPLDETKFNLLFSSDWHAYFNRAAVGAYLANSYGFDDCACLGDIVNQRFNGSDALGEYSYGGADYWNDTLVVLGNHDVLSDAAYPDWDSVTGHWGDVDWSKTVSNADAYNKYYAQYAANAGEVMRTGDLWWHKDYSDKRVKVIGLFCMAVSEADRVSQTAFLTEQLEDAYDNDMRVLILYHWAPNGAKYTPSNFTDDYWMLHTELADLLNAWELGLLTLVKEFQERGGRFISWLVGHSHGDNIGYYDIGGVRQRIINVCAQKPASTALLYRVNDSTSELAFDWLQLNDDDSVVLRRYGANNIVKGGTRDVLYM